VKGKGKSDATLRIAGKIVGFRCTGAKLNGRIVPLNTELKTGDIVSIITSKTGKPSRDWLNIAKTPHARNKIRTYFKKAGREDNIEKGKHMLEEAIKRHNITWNEILKKEWIDKCCQKHTLKSIDDIYASVGYGGLATGQVITFFVNKYKAENKEQEQDEIQVIKVKKPSTTSNGIIVKGQKNMLVRFAQCCHPVQGDQITGYITRGRGVSIHRSDCYNVKNLPADDPRFIEVSWEGTNTGKYNARLSITIADAPGMIVQISNSIQALGIDLVRFNATVTNEQVAKVELTVRISDTNQLDNLIKKIKTIEGCIDIYRRTS
jgi:GTP pyrophosphokinase